VLALVIPAAAGGSSGPSPKAQLAEIKKLIRLGLPIYCGGGTKPYVALTFDDGPGAQTPSLLDALRKYKARGTFFLVGQNVARRPGLAKRELRFGAVGVHTWSHKTLTGLPPAQLDAELRRPQKLLRRIMKRPINLVRPPFGAHDAVVDAKVKRLGMLEILWNADSGDGSEATTPSAERIAANVLDRAKAGSIVLMHENITGNPTVRALDIILPELKRRGLSAVSVPELLALDPPDPAQIPKGSGGCNSSWKPPGS
jgi:peptidoglycan-N-acetylglucosamine deacetylase